jgi:hypothetical protein
MNSVKWNHHAPCKCGHTRTGKRSITEEVSSNAIDLPLGSVQFKYLLSWLEILLLWFYSCPPDIYQDNS